MNKITSFYVNYILNNCPAGKGKSEAEKRYLYQELDRMCEKKSLADFRENVMSPEELKGMVDCE